MFDLCLLRAGVLDYGSIDFVRRSAFSQQFVRFACFGLFAEPDGQKGKRRPALDGSFSGLRWNAAYSECKKRRDHR